MKSFNTYAEAKAEADKKVRELSQGNQTLARTTKEVTGALAIRDTLDAYRRDTLPPNQSASPPKFIGFAELSRHVPLCERSLREAIRRGRIPSIRLPGARRIMFHWESVQSGPAADAAGCRIEARAMKQPSGVGRLDEAAAAEGVLQHGWDQRTRWVR